MSLRIEITSVEFGVYNGALLLNNRAVGTIQFNSSVVPKRVGKAVKLLRKLGIPVKFPAHFR